ncbi:hypothetical protein [Paraburkholderia solisilvae]|uniref:Uncharacterized protein n=1 Tax=Paraburkholderia solisilvae TaxID=624376 RepID=A0A6J5DS85_9BURK|nr:hypothetical protein [Paraburkholderia solisilvae]CAB3756868.1 hypothetical protein LMG29739_02560 [Paraburkholderia solisilvae]
MKTEGAFRSELPSAHSEVASNNTPATRSAGRAVQRAGEAQGKKASASDPQQPDAQTKSGKPATLSQYNTYAKYASSIVRQLLFGESRFNNSKLVMGTMLSALQVKGGLVPPGVRLGTLGMTRLNSATANFSRACGYIASAAEKRKAGKNADDDIVSATALMGEGLTEVSAGLGADVGNYLVKQWQTQLGKTSSTVATAAPSLTESDTVLEAETGTPIPRAAIGSDVDATLAHVPPMSPEQHEALMKQSEQTYVAKLDSQLDAMREREVQGIVEELEKTPPASQPARIAEISAQAHGRLDTAAELAQAAKLDISQRKTQSVADLTQLDKDMTQVREQMKSGKYTDPDVAGLSHEDAAKKLGARLLSYRRREEELAQGFEMLTEDASPDLEGMRQQVDAAKSMGSLENLPKEERLAKLEKMKTAYRENFLKYQNAISEPSANLPEWLKISPALKAQLGPAVLNTAFATADVGARIDDYVKKIADGSATEADNWKLAGSVVGLVGGMASFIPVVGPLVSIGLSLVGISLSSFPEHLAEQKKSEAIDALRDQAVDAYRKKHPGSENYVYKSDVGAGA